MQSYILWGFYSAISLLFSVWIAWHSLAQFNFLYPVWYSVLDIQQTVKTYAPANHYKAGFEHTDAIEHKRLFAEIVAAVQSKGEGLSNIHYLDKQSGNHTKLLTRDEVIHLQDVANLVQQLNIFCALLGLAGSIILGVSYSRRLLMPDLKRLLFTMLALLLIMSLAVMLLGTKEIFYWLHTKIFPAEHIWFFYYEDSLMSTLMKAPVLFAPISMLLLGAGVVLWSLHLLLLGNIRRFKANSR